MSIRRLGLTLLVTILVSASPVTALAEAGKLAVELNKLEARDRGCRAYLVIDNPTEKSFEVFRLDLIFFRVDGVIDRRLALDLAPIRATKKLVKTFDLETTPCADLGSVLVNDVLECRGDGLNANECLALLVVNSRSPTPFSK
jgi:hypothetical protein